MPWRPHAVQVAVSGRERLVRVTRTVCLDCGGEGEAFEPYAGQPELPIPAVVSFERLLSGVICTCGGQIQSELEPVEEPA